MAEGAGYDLRPIRPSFLLRAHLSHILSQTTTSDPESIRHKSTPFRVPRTRVPVKDIS